MDESNCKSSFAPPGVIRNGAMEQVYRSGEDNFNDGHDRFLARKKIEQFFVRQGFPPFSKRSVPIWTVLYVGCAIIITARKKKVLVVSLPGARSLLRPEKKIQSSVWRVRNHYYDQKKKSSSHLSGGCAIVIMTGKKRYSRLSGGCAIVITTEKKDIVVPSPASWGLQVLLVVPRVMVENLNVTNLY